VRIADLPDSSLHMLRVGQVRHVLSASPAYLATRGRPASLADLRNHDVIWGEDEVAPHRGWGLDDVRRSGRAARLSINNVEAAVSAAIAGLGVIRTVWSQIADRAPAGRLGRLLTDTPAPALRVCMLYQGGRTNHPNVRAFIEAVRNHLDGMSLWLSPFQSPVAGPSRPMHHSRRGGS